MSFSSATADPFSDERRELTQRLTDMERHESEIIAAHRAEVDGLNTQAAALAHDNDALERRVADAHREVQTLQAHLTEARDDAAASRDAAQQLRSQYEEAQEMHSSLRRESVVNHDAAEVSESLKARIAELDDQLRDARAALGDAQSETDTARQETEEWRARHARAQADLVEQRKKAAASPVVSSGAASPTPLPQMPPTAKSSGRFRGLSSVQTAPPQFVAGSVQPAEPAQRRGRRHTRRGSADSAEELGDVSYVNLADTAVQAAARPRSGSGAEVTAAAAAHHSSNGAPHGVAANGAANGTAHCAAHGAAHAPTTGTARGGTPTALTTERSMSEHEEPLCPQDGPCPTCGHHPVAQSKDGCPCIVQ